MKLLGHLPVLLARNPERVLTICFGTGMTFGATALHPEVEQSQCAELSATVLEAAPLFAEANGDVLTRPNARVRIGDGRQVLLASAQRFDVITAEPPPPRQAGTYQLYSREFYALARERLAEDGIVAQWLPLHDQSELEVRMSVRSFVDVFPNAQLWLPHAAEGILIGSPSPIVLDTARFAERWATPAVAESLASIGFTSPATLLKTFVMDGEALARYAAGAPAITDDRPLTDFWLDLPPFMKSADIGALLAYQKPITALGLADVNARPVEELREGHRAYLEGVIHNVRERVFEAHVAAPDDRFYAETLSIAPWQRANLEAALAARPDDVKLHLDLARVELNAHDFDAAVATLRKVTAGAPQLAIGWFNLGWTLEQADRLDEAREAYGQAIELDGRMRLQIEPRLAVLEAAKRLVDPAADAAVLAAAATTFGGGGRLDLALAALRRATDEDPGDGVARTALVKLLVDTGRHDEAELVLEGAAAPPSAALVLEGARNDLALGRFEKALAALPADSSAPEACWVRAQALRELGRGGDAKAALECAAKSRAPGEVEALAAALSHVP
ncbi:MAG: tetratricopeptide repeat protein [Deltaproteobacteria bacterium]|nr:tetratricopeptide repeat protein [Deltaproteobacteria bacterium]